jgi:hypothetical protein
MRRQIAYPALFALLLTTAIAGCQREPLPESRGIISFSVSSVAVSTEETKVDDGKPHGESYLIQTTTPARLFGRYTETGSTTSVQLFEGVSLSCTDVTGNIWIYTPSRYWAQNGFHDFCAVFPLKGSGQSYDLSTNTLTISDYSMEGGYDLMVASAQQDAATRGSDKITLPFVHANSAVRICFKDANGANIDPDYEITSLELRNLQTSSTLTYTGVSGTTPASIAWSTGTREATAYTWTASTADPAVAVTPATGEEYVTFKDWFYVVPQALVVAGEEGDVHTTLTFTYKAKTGGASQEFEASFNLDTGSTNAWVRGNAYTYYVTIHRETISLSVEWTDWETGQSFDLN